MTTLYRDCQAKACEDTLARKSVISHFRDGLGWNVGLGYLGYDHKSFGISKELSFKSVRENIDNYKSDLAIWKQKLDYLKKLDY